MPLNIKNAEVERLAVEVAGLTGETKTEAIRKALVERKSRLASDATLEARRSRLMRFLEHDVWPSLSTNVRGKKLTKKQREAILGYGPRGV